MFKFSLQRVLELKARREQAAAIELARTQAAADEARQAAEALLEAREEGVRQMFSSARPTVGEMRNAGYLLQALNERINQAQTVAEKAESRANESMGVFTVASQERRVLDKLRERHLTAWQTEQVQIDRMTMDTIALSRFTQSATIELEEECESKE
jgi:flagellar protein FliJ